MAPAAAKPRAFHNQLLQALSPGDLALLAPELEFKEFALRQVFETPNRPIKDLYFFERGMASVVADGNGSHSVEVGLIGREGVSGVSIILGGDRSPHSCYAQAQGAAHRISAKAFREKIEKSATLRGLLLRFANTFLVQTAQTALSNGRFKVEERLARWILMAQDRIGGNALPLTHEFLAIMLGVRRAGVTVALHNLQQRALIRSQRRQIAVLDRKGLERMANGAYGVPEAEYRRLIG
jgi:CRP-like cAMP-binding protein